MPACGKAGGEDDANEMNTASALHQDALVFDAHSDTLLRVADKNYQLADRHTEGDMDLPRMREGGLDVAGLAIFVHPRKHEGRIRERTLQLFQALERQLDLNSDLMTLARTTAEAETIVAKGKIAIFVGLEAGDAIQDSLDLLREYYERGVRYMTLTWINSNNWAGSSGESEKKQGMTDFGFKVVEEMNRLGMMVDLSHASDETVRDALRVSAQPMILSHSCSRSLCNIPRNIPDDLAQAIAERGGVVGVNYCLDYLDASFGERIKALRDQFAPREKELREHYKDEPEVLQQHLEALRTERKQAAACFLAARSDYRIVVDHIDHFVRLLGIDHVGLGSDFDGVEYFPSGLEDVTKLPCLTEEMQARGYDEVAIRKILGGNFMRVFRKVIG